MKPVKHHIITPQKGRKIEEKTCEEDNIIALYKMRQETMRVEQIKDEMRVFVHTRDKYTCPKMIRVCL